MPSISDTYDPKVGLMVQVGFLLGGAIEASDSKPAPPEQGQQHAVTTAPALIDMGASQTGISPQLATQLDLEPHGKIALQGATGSTSVNTYHVDFVLSFGTQAIVVQNLNSTPLHSPRRLDPQYPRVQLPVSHRSLALSNPLPLLPYPHESRKSRET